MNTGKSEKQTFLFQLIVFTTYRHLQIEIVWVYDSFRNDWKTKSESNFPFLEVNCPVVDMRCFGVRKWLRLDLVYGTVFVKMLAPGRYAWINKKSDICKNASRKTINFLSKLKGLMSMDGRLDRKKDGRNVISVDADLTKLNFQGIEHSWADFRKSHRKLIYGFPILRNLKYLP